MHPLWKEIDSAEARYHEVPYTRMSGDHAETGYIDLLYCTPTGWQVVDFKTDVIRNDMTRSKLIEQYKFQMFRYEKAVSNLLGHKPDVCICFLDDNGSINLVQTN
jgi:ATP-dependent exoDNAse (exonuclease V) beta subunit